MPRNSAAGYLTICGYKRCIYNRICGCYYYTTSEKPSQSKNITYNLKVPGDVMEKV